MSLKSLWSLKSFLSSRVYQIGPWISEASVVGDVSRQPFGVGAVDLREVRLADFDEVWPEPTDSVLAVVNIIKLLLFFIGSGTK